VRAGNADSSARRCEPRAGRHTPRMAAAGIARRREAHWPVRIVAADALLDPIALAAIAILVLNDHVLKPLAPGWVTGKLSDVAGLAFFPLLLLGAWELVHASRRRWTGPTLRPLAVAIAVTAIGFVLVKGTGAGASAYAWALGTLQWLVASVATLLTSGPPPVLRPVTIAQDVSDLVALVALVLAWKIGSARLHPARESTETEHR
jgi:hypothetical protein